MMDVKIYPLAPDDVPALRDILKATSVFNSEEIEVAVELMELALDNPSQRDYAMFTARDDAGKALGYYCVGPTPMTDGTFDLYWIASDPGVHGKGVGSRLLKHCEEFVHAQGGRMIVVETSSQEHYGPTRAFYGRRGYAETARVRDYYRPGDDLVIYSKQLKEAH
jgi:GNAT superfamily N-acetyltransferase